MTPDKIIQIECTRCDGTGLYCGFAEPKGVAVVCLSCKGTGCEEYHYTPFTGRKPRRGVQTVQLSRGTFIGTGVGPGGKAVTYAEFCEGKMPTVK